MATVVDLCRLVSELGSDPEPMLHAVGLEHDDLDDPDAMVPGPEVARLTELAVDATGCEHFGALLGARHDLQTYLGTLGRALWAAPDLRTAIARFTAHIPAHVEGSRWTLDVEGELARLRNEVAGPSLSLHGAGHNLVLAARQFRAITANRLDFFLTLFAAAEPADSDAYRRILQTHVLFNQEIDALVFHTTDLDLPVPTADPQLSSILLRHRDLSGVARSDDLVDEVERLVEKNLLAGIASIDAVARFLPISRSTLQQRLSDRGTSHQEILDAVRDRWAKDRLSGSTVSVAELARTLCFGSADTFTVAFKRRNGVPPTVWRARSRQVRLPSDAPASARSR